MVFLRVARSPQTYLKPTNHNQPIKIDKMEEEFAIRDMQPQNETKMDCYFAMFNCHKNNALEKTCNKFKEIWNDKKFETKIQPLIDKGVMSIFSEKPNRYTKFFVYYNRDVVNGDRS